MFQIASFRIAPLLSGMLLLSLGLPVPMSLAQDTPVPISTVQVANGKVTIRITNRTGEAIAYEAIGNTRMRSLGQNGTVTLKDLPLPTSLSFNYIDVGQPGVEKLLKLGFTQNPTTKVVEVTVNRTTDPAQSQGYMGIGRKGGVFVY